MNEMNLNKEDFTIELSNYNAHIKHKLFNEVLALYDISLLDSFFLSRMLLNIDTDFIKDIQQITDKRIVILKDDNQTTDLNDFIYANADKENSYFFFKKKALKIQIIVSLILKTK